MIARLAPLSVLLLILSLTLPARAQSEANGPVEYYAGGMPNAPVKIEVFSDYQCPSCRAFYLETLRYVLNEYSLDNRVSVVYHDFPLQGHQYSREATRYALAAQRLGRSHWLRLTDALYADQAQWSQDGRIDAIAARLFMPDDFLKLRSLLQDPAIEQAIERELTVGRARQVQSTPTFFIYAKGRVQKIVGGLSYPVLKTYLDRLLK